MDMVTFGQSGAKFALRESAIESILPHTCQTFCKNPCLFLTDVSYFSGSISSIIRTSTSTSSCITAWRKAQKLRTICQDMQGPSNQMFALEE